VTTTIAADVFSGFQDLGFKDNYMAAEVFAGFKDCNNCCRCFCTVLGFRV
jgi:hypothetical protein